MSPDLLDQLVDAEAARTKPIYLPRSDRALLLTDKPAERVNRQGEQLLARFEALCRRGRERGLLLPHEPPCWRSSRLWRRAAGYGNGRGYELRIEIGGRTPREGGGFVVYSLWGLRKSYISADGTLAGAINVANETLRAKQAPSGIYAEPYLAPPGHFYQANPDQVLERLRLLIEGLEAELPPRGAAPTI